MNNISVCIPTYKRPDMLLKLIDSILECDLRFNIINKINIIIIDNDPNKSAKKIAEHFKSRVSSPFEIHYDLLTVKGLSYIRNELIKKAFSLNSNYLIFVDDDEYVCKEWLDELVSAILKTKAEAVRGPVRAKLNDSIPNSISYWFKREAYPNYSQIYSLTTGNLILKCSSLKKHNIWFDSRFNDSGSEDSFFGIQIIKKGAKIFWADKAVTFETIPYERATLKWLIMRTYRISGTYTYILKIEGKYLQLIKKWCISLIYICSGIVLLPLSVFPFKKRYAGVLRLTEGIGGILGVYHTYKEYK